MRDFILLLFFSFILHSAMGQTVDSCWNPRQRGYITLSQKEFDGLVDFYIDTNSNARKLDTMDYITMVRLSNTIFFNRLGSSRENCWPESNQRYARFSQSCGGRIFFDQLTKYLGTCVPNFGMGCFYAKYNLDWGGGGPNDNSLFKIVSNTQAMKLRLSKGFILAKNSD